MVLLVQNNPQSREANRSHDHQRDMPNMWIAPVQKMAIPAMGKVLAAPGKFEA